MLTGLKPPTYETDLNNVKFGYIFRRDATNVRDDAVNALICSVCEVAVDAVITARRAGATAEDLLNVAEELCVDLEIESQDVCHGAIESHLVSDAKWKTANNCTGEYTILYMKYYQRNYTIISKLFRITTRKNNRHQV